MSLDLSLLIFARARRRRTPSTVLEVIVSGDWSCYELNKQRGSPPCWASRVNQTDRIASTSRTLPDRFPPARLGIPWKTSTSNSSQQRETQILRLFSDI